jgi:hypothetical protein
MASNNQAWSPSGSGAQSNYIKKQPATFTVMGCRLHFNNRLQVNQPGILLANDA